MAKKKNWQKKHNFKHVNASETAAAGSVAPSATDSKAVAAAPAKAPAANVNVRDFSYVASDMRRIGMAAVLLVALEVVLYFILTKTPAGSAIYSLVKL